MDPSPGPVAVPGGGRTRCPAEPLPPGAPCLPVKGRSRQAALGFRKQTLWGPLVFAFVLNVIQS